MNMVIEILSWGGVNEHFGVLFVSESSDWAENWNLTTMDLSWGAVKFSEKFLDEKYFFSHLKVGDNVISLDFALIP